MSGWDGDVESKVGQTVVQKGWVQCKAYISGSDVSWMVGEEVGGLQTDVRCGASPFRAGCQVLCDEEKCVSELIGEFGFVLFVA